MIEPRVYRNAGRFPPGRYQNKDCARNHNNVFAQVNGDDLYLENDWRKFRDVEIDRDYYFHPGYMPTTYLEDYRLGSCFRGWVLPTMSYIFDVSNDAISVSRLPQDLHLAEFIERQHSQIQQAVKDIYDRWPMVYLHYSGGIDALVMLSYVINLGFLHRTKFLYHKNLTQSHDPGVSFVDPELLTAIYDLFDRYRDQSLGYEISEMTLQDMARIANEKDYWEYCTYTTTLCLEPFTNTAHLHGAVGNNNVLHYKTQNDEILRLRGDYDELARVQAEPGHYSVYSYDFEPKYPKEAIVPIWERHLGTKLYNHTRPLGTNYLYTILADDVLSENFRRLNYRDLNHRDVFACTYTKQFLHRNVGDILDQYIIRGCQNENDHLKNMEIPVEWIAPQVLEICSDICHNPEGRTWLEHERDRAQTRGVIPINSLTAFKAQAELSKRVNGR